MENIIFEEKDDVIELSISMLDSYDDFDTILEFLVKFYNGKITGKLEVDVRIVYINIKSTNFKLVNSYGNI